MSATLAQKLAFKLGRTVTFKCAQKAGESDEDFEKRSEAEEAAFLNSILK